MSFDTGDKNSVLFTGLSGFWQRFFKDAQDIEAYYRASESYLGQVYLDLLGTILNIGVVDTPVFNKEVWKLFTLLETDVHIRSDLSSLSGQYAYSLPDDVTSVDVLQNSILSPTISLERDEAYTLNVEEDCLCFLDDPFNAYLGTDNIYMPTPGTAYRTVRKAVGNAAYDLAVKLYDNSTFNTGYAYRDFGLERGWTLRILAHSGAELTAGVTGSIVNNPGSVYFDAPGIGTGNVGDVIHVYGHDGSVGAADDVWKNFYIVKTIISPDRVELDPNAVPNTLISSTTNLYWKLNRSIYFTVNGTTPFRDYTVDYYEGLKFIGSVDNPFPLDLNGPLVAALIREEPDSEVTGVNLTYQTAVSGVVSPPFVVGAPGTTTQVTLGTQPLVPGSVKIYAYKYTEVSPSSSIAVVEGEDYTVDYMRGVIHQTAYWDVSSLGRCDFQVQAQVRLYGGISIEEYAVGNVRQLAYWAPEVQVDRFNLWYVYGSLVNRFDASSEAYKAFLQGIMYLYMTGPVLQRIESALNVAAEYPVAMRDGEILLTYDDGVLASGTTASLDGTTDEVSIPTADYTLSAVDIGGYIILSEALNDSNEGKFRIVSVDTTNNTATLETSYGLVTETPVAWVITHTYTKTITTNQRAYEYPYSVPIREDIVDQVNWNTLSFLAFEPLTDAFRVTDYVEDPTWWNNSVIPPLLWDATSARRRSSSQLYEHIIAPRDDAHIGDPGLYIGADEAGVVRRPTDPRDLTVFGITWQTGTTVRYTFSKYPDLSDIDITAGVTITVSNSLNAANDGTFTVTAVNLSEYWLEVTNGGRTDSSLDEGATTTATAALTGAEIPLGILRHNAAYIIFDQYLKMHMYYIHFDVGLDLSANFREDLEEIILVAKPSYLYPAVDTNAQFIDNVGLTSDFTNLFSLLFGGNTDGGLSDLHIANNVLNVNDSDFPWQIGEFYKYSTQALTPTVTDPIPVGTTILPSLPAECSLLRLTIGATRTADGEPVLEGRDYTVNWLAEYPVGTPNPIRWQVEFLTECTAGGLTLPLSCFIAERLVGTYNTTEGWTPTFIGGLNPWYIRNGALDPTSGTYTTEFDALRTEVIDRPIQLTVVPDTATPTVSYTYP